MKCDNCHKQSLIKLKILMEKSWYNYCKSCYILSKDIILYSLELKEIFLDAQAEKRSNKAFDKEKLNWK